jgi:RNA polymerase sigma-70 factor (ECF subfamily)
VTRRSDDALTATLQEASPRLLAYLIRHLEHRENAADALADVLLAAWRRRRTLPAEPDQLNAWLFTAARYAAQNQRRANRRAARLAEQLKLTLPIGARDTLDPAVRTSDIDEIERAIDALPPSSAELVRLIHWEGLSIAAASAVLQIAPSTGRSRYQVARAQLRDHLAASSRSPA